MTAAFDQKKQDIRELIDVLHRNIDDPVELAAALSALIEIVEDKPAELVPFPLDGANSTVKSVGKVIGDWLYYDGECPTDQQFATQVKYLIEQWAKERENGLDIVADSHLEHLQELVSTLDGI